MKNFLIKKIFFLLLILGLYSHSAMTAESLTGKAKMDQLIGEYERRARQANTLEQKVLILIETMKGKINPHDLRDIYYTARFVNRLFNQQITFNDFILQFHLIWWKFFRTILINVDAHIVFIEARSRARSII